MKSFEKIARVMYAAFHRGEAMKTLREAERLRSLGYEVVNPAELNPDPSAGWHECMRRDLTELLTCDALALMDGWQKSAVTHLEMHVAHRVGMEIVIAREVSA